MIDIFCNDCGSLLNIDAYYTDQLNSEDYSKIYINPCEKCKDLLEDKYDEYYEAGVEDGYQDGYDNGRNEGYGEAKEEYNKEH